MLKSHQKQQLFPYLYHSYIRKNLGTIMEDDMTEVDTLKKELEESKAKIIELKSKLTKYEPEDVKAD